MLCCQHSPYIFCGNSVDLVLQLSHDPIMQVGHYTCGLYESLQCNPCYVTSGCGWNSQKLPGCFTFKWPRTRYGADVHVISDQTRNVEHCGGEPEQADTGISCHW